MKSTGFFQFLEKNISVNDQKDLFEIDKARSNHLDFIYKSSINQKNY